MDATSDVPVSDQPRADRHPAVAARQSGARGGWSVALLAVALLAAGCTEDDASDPAATTAPESGADESSADASDEGEVAGSAAGAGDSTAPDEDVKEAVPDVETRAPEDSDDSVSDLEDDVTPPGFYPPESVLVEDAFDGPDLVLHAVEGTEGESGPMVELHVRGTGFPGWEAQYVDGAGVPAVDAGTEAVLAVELAGVAAGAAGDDLPSLGSPVTGLIFDEAGSDRLTLYLGISEEPVPFRVHLQHTPLRLVVEIAGEA